MHSDIVKWNISRQKALKTLLTNALFNEEMAKTLI
jgi:hypothetical protein